MDQRLSAEFSIEEFIEVMFTKNETTGIFIGQEYINHIAEEYPRGYSTEIKELQKIYEYMEEEKIGTAIEKCSSQVIDILDNTLCVTNLKEGNYVFDPKILSKSTSSLHTKKEKIDMNIALAFLLAEDSHTTTHAETYMLCTHAGHLHQSSKTSILSKEIQNIYCYPAIPHIDKSKRQELFEKVGADATRLYCLSMLPQDMHFKEQEAEPCVQEITKLRNARRFMYVQYIESKKKAEVYNIQELAEYIKKRIAKCSPTEQRILAKLQELRDESKDRISQNDYREWTRKVFSTIKNDFCDKYIEINKIAPGEIHEKVALFTTAITLQLLYPIIPFATEAVRSFFGFENNLAQYKSSEFPLEINKNYKTQLFMDIIDKFQELRTK